VKLLALVAVERRQESRFAADQELERLCALTQLPVGSAGEGRNAGFAFEMHYVMGNLVPWQEPAWALLRERTAFLGEKCCADPDVLRTAGETATSVADKLAAHVPAELRCS
jgi:hypothetical protein